MRSAEETRQVADYPRGIAWAGAPLSLTGSDVIIYKSIAVLAGIALPLIAGVNWHLRGTVSWPQLAVTGALLASALLCWALSRSGRRDIAAALLIGLLWSSTTIYAFESGYGMHSAVVFVYLPCVLYTALFFGLPIATAELALTVAALVLMYFAEEGGRIGGAREFARQGTNFNFLLGVILTAAGTLIVSLVYHRRIERDAANAASEAEQRRQAMEQAQVAGAQLATANARLQSLNDELTRQSGLHAQMSVSARHDLDLYHDVIAKDLPVSLDALRAAIAAPGEDIETRLLREIDRMQAVVGALAEVGGQAEPALEHTLVDLSSLAHNEARHLRARNRYARVRVEVDPGMRVRGDRVQVASLLHLLMKRAAGACQSEPGALVHVGRATKAGRPVYFVRDNGPGMSQEQCDSLFRPFDRGNPRNSADDTVDTGIVSARRIAERHGGELYAESAPGRGTAFFFSFAPD
jgi:signal transduction histidine kinase